MSQTPHPHDPYGSEPGTPASDHLDIDQPGTGGPAASQPAEEGSPTSDPALHPHDPFAQADPYAQSAPAQPSHYAQGSPYGASGASAPSAPSHDPYAAGAAPFAAHTERQYDPRQDPSFGQQPQGQQFSGQQYAGQQQYAQQAYGNGAPQGAPHPDASPLPQGFKGLYEGPITGQPVSASDSKMWSMFSHLSAVLGYVVGAGFLGWVGPLVIFLMYKDRDRFVRYNAAETLNAAIATVIAEVVLSIAITIFAAVTFGIGSIAFPLVWLPAVLHVIFAIIGAVKSNKGEYWNYPLNIRFVK